MKTYQHTDNLGQDIIPGQPIAFTASYLKGVKLGIVKNLTQRRVRIHYVNKYYHNNQYHKVSWDILLEPQRTIMLGNELEKYVTLQILNRS